MESFMENKKETRFVEIGGQEKQKLRELLFEVLNKHPDGITWTDWKKEVQDKNPDVTDNQFLGAVVYKFDEQRDVYKPDRGVYRLKKYRDQKKTDVSVTAKRQSKAKEKSKPEEKDFYQSFAYWLVTEGECSKALPLGGNKFGGKWGTPDVMGATVSNPLDDVKRPEPEITSVEIKLNTSKLIEAFGQACAYRLFSHKVWLVVPKNSSVEDRGRLNSLCNLFGIGLVLFNSESKDNPGYELKNRAQGGILDYAYLNAITENKDFFIKLLSSSSTD